MDPRSDQELIRAYRGGDDQALNILIQRHLAGVYRFLYRLVGEASTAEDLAQETFLKMWHNLRRYDTTRPFKAWLLAIARHTAVDYLRKKKPLTFSQLETEDGQGLEETLADEQPLPPEILARADAAQLLADALATLNPQASAVVLMHETEELTFQEIAEAVDEPLNTVKSRYRRAILQLQKYLSDQISF